ncbi:MAG: pyridoxal kinase [Alphaproteobacteria bacterium]
MGIVCISSHVAYGHVGGQAVILPLQCAGHEVWHVPTVLFSNHPGHGGFRGRPVAADWCADMVQGLHESGFLGRARGLISGYLGDGAQADAVLAARRRIPRSAPYLCDPVLGDAGRVYVKDEVVVAMRERLVPAADAVTPNRFELSLLTGRPADTLEDVLDALTELRAMGPRLAICTSAMRDDDRLVSVLADDDGFRGVSVPRHASAPYGTGDLLAALLLAGLVAGTDPADALRQAMDILHSVIADSLAAASPELTLVASRARFSEPVPQVARVIPLPA